MLILFLLFQVVGKSCKPIPVMILGVLIGRKRYPLLKYLFILLIVIGVALFMFKDGKSNKAAESGDSLLGEEYFKEVETYAMYKNYFLCFKNKIARYFFQTEEVLFQGVV